MLPEEGMFPQSGWVAKMFSDVPHAYNSAFPEHCLLTAEFVLLWPKEGSPGSVQGTAHKLSYCHRKPVSLFFSCLYLQLHFTDDDENTFNKKTRSITTLAWDVAKHVIEVRYKVRNAHCCCEADSDEYRSRSKLLYHPDFSYSVTALFQGWNAKVAFSCSPCNGGCGGCISLFCAFTTSRGLYSTDADVQRWCRPVLCACLPSWPTYSVNGIVECVSHRYGCATTGVLINRTACLCCWVI